MMAPTRCLWQHLDSVGEVLFLFLSPEWNGQVPCWAQDLVRPLHHMSLVFLFFHCVGVISVSISFFSLLSENSDEKDPLVICFPGNWPCVCVCACLWAFTHRALPSPARQEAGMVPDGVLDVRVLQATCSVSCKGPPALSTCYFK